MRRLLTVLTIMLMVLSLSGCGNKKEEEAPVEDVVTDGPAEEKVSDEDLAASLSADLVGTWNYSTIEQEKLSFYL